MFKSLQSRLWLTYALIILVLLSSIAILGFLALRNIPIRNTNTQLQTLAVTLGRQRRLEQLSQERLRLALQELGQLFDVRILMVDLEGRVLFDTRAEVAPEVTAIRIPPGARIREARPPTGTFRDAENRLWLYAIRPLHADSYLVLATPRPTPNVVELLSDRLLPPLVLTASVAALLAVFLSILMSRWVSAPLKRIAAAARNIAHGEYRTISPEGPAEVQQLALAFNEMTARVQASQQSQRDFVANVSHELKTPLTSIQGFAQALLDGTVNDPQGVQRAAQVIHNEAGRMHRLVLDLLDLARLDSGVISFQRLPVDLNTLLQQVVDKFAPQAQQTQIRLQTDVQPLPTLIGDGDRLAQVFTNLVDNALQHTPAGGQITVRARQRNGMVEISVRDTGPGIPYEEQKRIFERFYRLDKARTGGRGHGVGLGLAIAHEIVQAHGGYIALHSQPGQGSNFVVKLPFAKPDDSTAVRRRR